MVLKQCMNPGCRDWRPMDELMLLVRDEVVTMLCVDCVIEVVDPVGVAERAMAGQE